MSSSEEEDEIKRRRNLTAKERKVAVLALINMMENNKVPHGSYGKIAAKFSVDRKTIARLWNDLEQKLLITMTNAGDPGAVVHKHQLHFQAAMLPEEFYSSGRKNSGSFKVYNEEEIMEQALLLSPHERRNERSTAAALGVSQSLIHRMKLEGYFDKVSIALKPTLTTHHMDLRIIHALGRIEPLSYIVNTRSPYKYEDFFDTIHIDEKWFYEKRQQTSMLAVAGEKPPNNTAKHKSHVLKVQFICAMARPQWNNGEYFDGKIGIWPVGHWGTYIRGGSVNPKGSAKWIDHSIDGDEYFRLLMDKVLPAIVVKHPLFCKKKLYIQHDGAPSHGVLARNPEIFDQAVEDTLGVSGSVKLFSQPPQSPDTNILDLGLFNALQSDYHKRNPKGAEQIIDCVYKSFEEYPSHKINRLWLTLQSCLNEIILQNGGNDYSIPHMAKEKLEREGRLPEVLEVVDEAEPLMRDLNMIMNPEPNIMVNI